MQLIEQLHSYEPILVGNAFNDKSRYPLSLSLNIPYDPLKLILYILPFTLKVLPFLHKQGKTYGSVTLYSLSFHPLNYILALAAKILNLKFILTVHDYTTHLGEKSKLVEFIQKKTMKLSDTVVFLSEYERNKAVKDGHSKEHSFVLPHPIFQYKQQNQMGHSQKLKLLVTGRMLEYKGLDILEGLLESKWIEEICVAGSGSKDLLKFRHPKLKIIDKWLEEKEIEELILNYHLMVLAYKEASQSGVLAKAFSYAIPIMLTRTGGLVEQIPEDAAIWFDGSLEDALNKIEQLASSSFYYENLKSHMKDKRAMILKIWNNRLSALLNMYSIN